MIEGLAAYPGKEPRLDALAGSIYGEPVEDVDRLGERQQYAGKGPWVLLETLEFVHDNAARRKIGRFDLAGSARPVAALAAAGLMTEAGAWTEEGNSFAEAFRSRRGTVSVDGWHLGRHSKLNIWLGSEQAVLAAGPSAHALRAGGTPVPLARQLDLVPVAAVPGAILSWAGLTPAWPLGVEFLLAQEAFEARRKDAAVPAPAGADPVLNRIWANPWFDFSVAAEETQTMYHWLNAGTAGLFAIDPLGGGGGDTVLRTAPSSLVFSRTVGQINSLLTR